MLIISGNNLGERHRDLNSKITEAAQKKTNLDEVKAQEEKYDVDKLFEIGLASKYKDIHYILEVLKGGDIFHMTRALKCLWIYEDEYAEYINPKYLKEHIFTHMSTKMEKKLLTITSMNLRNGERAKDFYEYCKDEKMTEYAYKFLVFTPDNYKLEVLKDRHNFHGFRESKFIKQFIGDSFELAFAYIRFHDYNEYIIHELRYLCSVSAEKYLNMLQDLKQYDAKHSNSLHRLGLRISKDILIHHRHRVIKYPVLYVNKLNKNMLIKYLTIEDVKLLAFALVPSSPYHFWRIDFYRTYKFILEKIPTNEIFDFVKDIFISSYPDESFEFSVQFYKSGYYEMFTVDQREEWALLHIKRDEEWSEIENYMWYRFVSFEKAFSGLKQYVFLTPDKDKRCRIVNVLPETARNQSDTMKILSYYYQRHVNESEDHKDSFINKIIKHNDIYSFNNECWTALDQLFYSLDLYTSAGHVRTDYKARALIYYILHDKELPDVLTEIISYSYNLYNLSHIIDELTAERKAIVAKYLIQFYFEKLLKLLEQSSENIDDDKDENDEDDTERQNIKDEIDTQIQGIWNVIHVFKRDHKECPEVALQYMESNIDCYQHYDAFKPKFNKRSEGDFVRWIKQDIEKAVDGIKEIRCNTYRWNFRLCRLFRKLKVYLPDVGNKYLEYFQEYLSNLPKGRREYRNIKMAVIGVLYLANEEVKNNFIEKNIPENPKIDHMHIDNRVLQVQKAICRLAYHSRPPLSLSTFRKYIVGDYVHYCLPVFYNYLANSTSLPNFIESVIDAPLSIQKHGLRLAFVSYSPDLLEPLIINAWKRTKNISLRKLLFETLFYRILKENEEVQKTLYEILKYYTSELNHDDDEYIYSLLIFDDFPEHLKGDFIEIAWLSVSQLTDKTIDTARKTNVIKHMETNMHLVQREFPRVQIIDGHVHDMLIMKNIKTNYNANNLQEHIDSKWSLTAKYLMTYTNKDEQQRSLDLLNTIITKCLEMWDHVDDKVYTLRKFVSDFTRTLMSKDPKEIETCGYIVPIYQCILNILQNSLNIDDIYLLVWELKLSIAFRKYLHPVRNHGISKCCDEVTTRLSRKISTIIKTLSKENGFHHSFYQSVADVISKIGITIGGFISLCDDLVNLEIMIGLTNINMEETHILAAMMLPRDPPYYRQSEHRKVIKNLKKFKSKEVRSLLYEKFVSSDYHFRDCIL